MPTSTYRIVVEGEFDEVTAAMFRDLRLTRGEGCTSLSTAEIDPSGLDGILDRLRMIGAALVSLDRAARSDRSDAREG